MSDAPTTLDALQARLATAEAEAGALRAELEETNKGVVALYAELDDKAIQLKESLELKSRFLSYMSHEFRTPLTSVTSISHILLQQLDGPLTAEQAKQVQFIQGSVQELTDMVNDLLDLAKVEAGRIAISPEWFEMVDLFSALRGMFKPILVQTHALNRPAQRRRQRIQRFVKPPVRIAARRQHYFTSLRNRRP